MSQNTAPPATPQARISTEEIKRRITQMYGWAETAIDPLPAGEASNETGITAAGVPS